MAQMHTNFERQGDRDTEIGRKVLSLRKWLYYSLCFSMYLKYFISFLIFTVNCGKISITKFTILNIFNYIYQWY